MIVTIVEDPVFDQMYRAPCPNRYLAWDHLPLLELFHSSKHHRPGYRRSYAKTAYPKPTLVNHQLSSRGRSQFGLYCNDNLWTVSNHLHRSLLDTYQKLNIMITIFLMVHLNQNIN